MDAKGFDSAEVEVGYGHLDMIRVWWRWGAFEDGWAAVRAATGTR